MAQMTVEVPDSALSALRKGPTEFARELRLAAAVKWYERRMISQGRAAEIAGMSRAEFLEALSQYGVSPFQVDAEDLTEEIGRE